MWLNKLTLQEFMKLFQLVAYHMVSFLLLKPSSCVSDWIISVMYFIINILLYLLLFVCGLFLNESSKLLHVARLVLLTDGLNPENIQRRPLKKFIPHLISVLVDFGLKLLSCILLLPWLKGLFVVHHSCEKLENQTKSPLPCPRSQEQSISQAVENQSFHPCWERLQRLEELVTELVNKPKRIPPEKEDMLLESLSRIKSIEHDLQRTKKVSSVIFLFAVYAECFFNLKNLALFGAKYLCSKFSRHCLLLHQNKWSLLNHWNN